MERKKKLEDLRSHRWLGRDDLRSFGHRSRLKQAGYAPEEYTGKPLIAILNTWSDLIPCHSHFRQRAEEVKRGVWQAGGFPVEIPALAISETFMKPSPMLYRNLLAMEVEELLRSQPIDGVVLMGGCDKTTPGLLMGAISANLPAIFLPAGPMLRGNWRGEVLGSGSDVPGASSIPAVDSNHSRLATRTGRTVVDLVWKDLKPQDLLTLASFDNAITVDMAIGGSTNAIVHLIALAGRCGTKIDLNRFDQLSRRTPMIANIRPAGEYLMEDFFYAGGLPALLNQINDLLCLDCQTVSGKTLGENLAGAKVFNARVIRSRDDPIAKEGGTAVLYGNLAPNGAVIKHTAAEAHLLQHTGPAVVFENYSDLAARIDNEQLPVTADSVLVLQNAGPLGGPGMPEWGMLPIPQKLLKQGIRDMVRISDARMSGTSYGTCILHVSPESFVGGPLALVRDGDLIELNVAERRLTMHVSEQELNARKQEWQPATDHYQRGFGALFAEHVTQAHEGCDFDFLQAGEETAEPEIH